MEQVPVVGSYWFSPKKKYVKIKWNKFYLHCISKKKKRDYELPFKDWLQSEIILSRINIKKIKFERICYPFELILR